MHEFWVEARGYRFGDHGAILKKLETAIDRKPQASVSRALAQEGGFLTREAEIELLIASNVLPWPTHGGTNCVRINRDCTEITCTAESKNDPRQRD